MDDLEALAYVHNRMSDETMLIVFRLFGTDPRDVYTDEWIDRAVAYVRQQAKARNG